MDPLDSPSVQSDNAVLNSPKQRPPINNTSKYSTQITPFTNPQNNQHATKNAQSQDSNSKQSNDKVGPKTYTKVPDASNAMIQTPNSSRGSKVSPANVFALNYSKRELTKLPDPIMDFASNLLILDLSRNRFSEFPLAVLKLVKLKTLRLEYNNLKKIPAEISKFANLENLSLSHNQLTQIPRSISKLNRTLATLNLANNHLESLCKEITELTNLRILQIQCNHFTTLPITFDHLSSLKELGLEWFKYTNPPLSIIQNEKSRFAIIKLFQLCKNLTSFNKTDITFEDFILHFSISNENLLNAKDSLQRNLLHIATLEEEVGIVKYLTREKGSLVNQVDHDKQSPLSLAVREDKPNIAKLLLANGADPNIGGGAFGSSLHMSTTKLNLGLVKELLKHGADTNCIDFEKNTPLHLLFSIFTKDSKTSAEIANLLIEYGGDPNLRNNDGWAPIHLAVRRGQTDCIKWIVKHNLRMKSEGKDERLFDINLKGGGDRWSSLHLASSLGHYEIISLLLDNDADMIERTKTGKSVREVAANNIIVNKLLKKIEGEWMQRNLFKKQDLEHKLRDVSLTANVQTMKSMISSKANTAKLEENKGNSKVINIHNKLKNKNRNGTSGPIKERAGNEKSGANKNDQTEDSLMLGDVDEVVETKETTRSIPRSPNNIQKLQIAQNYRNHLINRGFLSSATTTASGTGVNSPVDSIHAVPKLIDSSKKIVNRVNQENSPSNPPTSVPHKGHVFKFLFPSDFTKYIKNFDNYHDEIKSFRNAVLSHDSACFSEKLKYMFFLRAIHMKINQTVKKMRSELMPVELFIVSEFIDDEFKRTNYVTKGNNIFSNVQNIDLIPRTLLFIFENLQNYDSSEEMLIKTKACQLFGDLQYLSATHFLEQMIHIAEGNYYLKREGKIALKEIKDMPPNLKAISMSPLRRTFGGGGSSSHHKAIHQRQPSGGNLTSNKKSAQKMTIANFQSVDNFNSVKGFASENVDDDEEEESNAPKDRGLRSSDKKVKVPKVNMECVKAKRDQKNIMSTGKEVLETEPGEPSMNADLLTSDRGQREAPKGQMEPPKKMDIRNAPNKLKVKDYFSNNSTQEAGVSKHQTRSFAVPETKM